MIESELYMKQIRPFMNRPFIKVIAGIRRCGKLVVLQLIAEELERQGIDTGHIVYMNFESFEWMDITDAKALYLYIKDKVEKTDGKIYILLDEIQEVKDWEKAINSFMVDWDVDVYVTGSNSRLLSSELSTYLAGRYVCFHIMPLSFNEYLLFHGINPDNKDVLREEFQKYLRMGGFPAVHTGDYSYESIYKLVYDIYSSVILRDTVQRPASATWNCWNGWYGSYSTISAIGSTRRISPTISKASNGGWISIPFIIT